MANGSFGLSGFPTAPTTTSTGGSTAVSAFTQAEVTLTSANGFSSGDLVYQYNSDFQPITSAASASATFPVESQKVTNSTGGVGSFQYVLPIRTTLQARNTTTLSNGNIVWVYVRPYAANNYPCFTITDENNTVIVSETIIESVSMPTTTVGPTVCALAGGGFVVAFVNSSSNLRYAVYTNTGTVTTALQNDTGVLIVSWHLSIAPRPVSGGFVIAVQEQSTATIKHRVFGPTGTATYAWTSNNTLSTTGYYPRTAVRSDDSFIVVSQNPGTNTFVYYVWTSTNTATTNSNFAASLNNGTGTDVCALTNDVYILIANTTTGFVYRTLTGTTLSGSSVNISPGTTSAAGFISARALTSGGWAAVYTLGSSISATDGLLTRTVFINVYNSTSTLLSVTYKGSNATYTGYPYNFIPGSNSPTAYFGLTETTNYIHVVCNGYTGGNRAMQWSKISKTTYAPLAFTASTISASNTAALATAAYAPSSSTPTTAAFYAASTATVGWVNAAPTSAGVNAIAANIDTGLALIRCTDAATLSDGKVVVVWSGYESTPSTVYYQKYIVYSANGSPLTANTTISNSSNLTVRTVGLTNGKFVIYANSTLYVYSSSGALLTSLAVTYTVDTNHPINMAALPNNRFVVFANASNTGSYYLQYTVFNDSLTALAGPTTIDSANSYPNAVATIGSNIYFFYTPSGSTGAVNTMAEYIEASTNTWSNTSSASISGQYPYGSKCTGFNNGTILRPTHDNASTAAVAQINTADGTSFATFSASTIVPSSGFGAVDGTFQAAVTGNGNVAFICSPNSGTSTDLNIYYGLAGYSGAVSTTTISGSYPSSGAVPTLAGMQGERVLLAYVTYNTSTSRHVMTVAYVNFGQTQGTVPITAGSSVSNASLSLNTSAGYSLIGVATSTAAAGGSGTVAINGTATLNTNYQSIASPGQSFDFSSPVRFGAAGSVIGRVVTLQGNV